MSYPGKKPWKGRSPRNRRRHSTHPAVFDWQKGPTPMPTTLNCSQANDWVDQILEKANLSFGVAEEELRKGWRQTVGDFIAGQSEIISLKHGLLTLRALQPTLRFQLEQTQGQLLSKLQKQFGSDTIKKLRLISG